MSEGQAVTIGTDKVGLGFRLGMLHWTLDFLTSEAPEVIAFRANHPDVLEASIAMYQQQLANVEAKLRDLEAAAQAAAPQDIVIGLKTAVLFPKVQK